MSTLDNLGLPESSKKAGGNVGVLSNAADNAKRIMEGKIPLDELNNMIEFIGDQYHTGFYQKKLDTIHPRVLDRIFEPNNGLSYYDKWLLIDCFERVFKEFQSEYEKESVIIIDKIIEVYKSSNHINASKFSSVIGYIHSYFTKDNKEKIQEYFEFVLAYLDVIPTFYEGDGHKLRTYIQRIWSSGCWKQFFQYTKMVSPSDVSVLHWYYESENLWSYFGNLTEEDIRFLASISTPHSPNILDYYVASKNSLGEHHQLIWQKIQKLLEGNKLKDTLIQIINSELDGWLGLILSGKYKIGTDEYNDVFRDLEYLVSFGAKVVGEFRSYDAHLLLEIKNLLKNHPGKEEILGLFELLLLKDMNVYLHVIKENHKSLPSTQLLSTYFLATEEICTKFANSSESIKYRVLTYFFHFGHISGSRESLEAFLQAHPNEPVTKILSVLPMKYEHGWEKNPLYSRLIKAKQEDFYDLLHPKN